MFENPTCITGKLWRWQHHCAWAVAHTTGLPEHLLRLTVASSGGTCGAVATTTHDKQMAQSLSPHLMAVTTAACIAFQVCRSKGAGMAGLGGVVRGWAGLRRAVQPSTARCANRQSTAVTQHSAPASSSPSWKFMLLPCGAQYGRVRPGAPTGTLRAAVRSADHTDRWAVNVCGVVMGSPMFVT